MSDYLAAVDCGTNSTRLLISRDAEQVHQRTIVTGLGRGVDGSGILSGEGIQRTLDVLRHYANDLAEFEVEAVRAFATSAVRDAQNAADFIGPAGEILGVELETLSGHDEATLGFNGAISAFDDTDELTLVVDIGGGSTEFALGRSNLGGAISMDMGSVRFTERFVHHDPPEPEELSNLISMARSYVEEMLIELPDAADAARLVGLSGTITTVAAVEIGMDPYDAEQMHLFELTHEAAEDVFRTLATEPFEDRQHNPGLAPERADVIVAGTAILVAIMRALRFDRCIVSERDLLDGAVASLVDPPETTAVH
ncbi:MAG: exopolyphosphatase [Acidimicrobiales bacterium]